MLHKRKNIRLQGYDYSHAGLYFLTIVVQNRLQLFGHIENGMMILNDAGQMIEKWYREIENKYPDKRCHELVVLPNHFHCIIENMETPRNEIKTVANMLSTDENVMGSTDAHVSGITDANVTFRDAHVGAPTWASVVGTWASRNKYASRNEYVSRNEYASRNRTVFRNRK